MTHLPKSLMKPEQWCLPAVIYALIIVAYIVGVLFKDKMSAQDKAYAIIMQLLVAFVILVIMLLACEAGLEWIPWMMLLVPVVWIGGIMMGWKACKEGKAY